MTQGDGERRPAATDTVAAWVTEYGPGLKRYFQRRVPAAEVEDLVQDVFLAMHARQDGGPVENVQGYLFAIASNLLAKRKPTLALTALDEAGALADGFSPERLFISHQEAVLAIAAIRKLPARSQEAFVLHRFENMTYAAIAKKLNISVSAVGKLVSRALAQLTEELEPGP
jgi:RNA polymerase sigma factor (sigma-70 family)